MSVEVHGSAVKSVIEGCGVFQKRVKALLAEKGIVELELEAWYSLDHVITVITDLSASVGSNLLLEIGKYITKNSVFPPEMDSFEKAVALLDVAYQMNHRNGNYGEYKCIQEDIKTIRFICNVPYPAMVNLGILRGFARKFQSLATIEEVNMNGGGEFIIRL
ncbi:hypothetical protein FHS16_005546 [Paenibacillus endophyticus]|uniref:Uncharacterized protein n=1 Tax=Paenibacillus endophyticus TaxID=1294268 RepID=A0A7W5GDG7_9BACL|nr:hypothetical protein [Paenibacillus endophyticus]MBB3155438.1 hypothetical protein [Paenibacillus endophyticus]